MVLWFSKTKEMDMVCDSLHFTWWPYKLIWFMLQFVKCKTSCNAFKFQFIFSLPTWAIFWPKGFNIIDKINHAFHGILGFSMPISALFGSDTGNLGLFRPLETHSKGVVFAMSLFPPSTFGPPPHTYRNLPNKGAGHWRKQVQVTWRRKKTSTFDWLIREVTVFLPAPRISNKYLDTWAA